MGKIVSSIAETYFPYQIEQDNLHGSVLESERKSALIRTQTDKFATDFIAWLEKDFEKKKAIQGLNRKLLKTRKLK